MVEHFCRKCFLWKFLAACSSNENDLRYKVIEYKKEKKKIPVAQLLSPVQILIFTQGRRKSKNVVILIQTSVRRGHREGFTVSS